MVTVGVVEHDDAFHACAVHQQAQVVLRALHGCGVVVLADRAADDDAGFTRQFGQHGVEDFAADVVEVDVHPFGAVFLQAVAHGRRAGLVVDTGVKAQLVHHPVTLGLAARNTHHAAALDLGQLAHRLAHGTGRTRHHHGFTRLGLAHIHQAKVAGHAGHTQHVEPLGGSAHTQVDLDQAVARDLLLRHQDVLLHTQRAVHMVTHGKSRVLRGNHLAHTTGPHHFVDAHGRDVTLAFVHPAAHGRVERQRQGFDQHTTVGRLSHRLGGEGKVGAGGNTLWAAGQANLVVDESGGHGGVSCWGHGDAQSADCDGSGPGPGPP